MQEKVWLNAYEAGVPACIGDLDHESVAAYMDYCCQRFADLPAISNFGVHLTYAELQETSARLAGYFQQQLKLNKGCRLAIVMPNLLQYPVTLLGALKAGLVVVSCNPAYSQRELLVQLKDCEAEVIVIFAGCAHLLENILVQTSLRHVIVTNVGDLFPQPKSSAVNFYIRYIRKKIRAWNIPDAITFSAALEANESFSPVALGPSDTALLQYTGGTTGTAKGAILSHGNLLANIVQTGLWTKRHLRERREVVIVALPLYHIFGLTIVFLSNLQFGGLHVLIADPRDTRGLIRTMRKSGCTVFAGVNALFVNLLSARLFRKLDFSGLRMVIGGGAAIQASVAKKWQQITGIPITQAYGLTEASPGVCCNPLYLAEFNGSVGLPVCSTQIKIQLDDASVAGYDQPGELVVKGPQVMQGYWRKPEETRQVLSERGWLKTGDIATMDEHGYLRIVDRKKDLIVVSGFNVYPGEVEEVLKKHPDIVEACVVGNPHKKIGEIVVAFVVRTNRSLSKEEVEGHCRNDLAAYKVPRDIRFVADIPKSNLGKPLRRELRNALASDKNQV